MLLEKSRNFLIKYLVYFIVNPYINIMDLEEINPHNYDIRVTGPFASNVKQEGWYEPSRTNFEGSETNFS